MKVLKFLGIHPTHIGATQPWRFYFTLRGSSSNNKKVLKTQRKKKHKKCKNNLREKLKEKKKKILQNENELVKWKSDFYFLFYRRGQKIEKSTQECDFIKIGWSGD